MVAAEPLRKPDWIRVRAGGGERFLEIKKILRDAKLNTVCEEASCPNIGECFGHGTATFMIMGDLCTRRCPFCDVAHGRPQPLDADEPRHLGETIAAMKLRYVVVTSVDRDDLRDGGAQHFVDCIRAIRRLSPGTRIEILTPDFRGRLDRALAILAAAPPDVMNHNLETVPRLYAQARPGSDYAHSLALLGDFKAAHPGTPTKSGLMVGLGETSDEILAGDARPARPRRGHAHHRAVPAALEEPPARRALRAPGRVPDVRGRGRGRWASPTPRAGRWCVPATTRTGRRGLGGGMSAPVRGDAPSRPALASPGRRGADHLYKCITGGGPSPTRRRPVPRSATRSESTRRSRRTARRVRRGASRRELLVATARDRFARDARDRELARLREREARARGAPERKREEANRPVEDIPWNPAWGFPAKPGQALPQPKPAK